MPTAKQPLYRRFTVPATRTVYYAQEEAKRRHETVVGSEHGGRPNNTRAEAAASARGEACHRRGALSARGTSKGILQVTERVPAH